MKILVTEDLRGIHTPEGWDELLDATLRRGGFEPEFWDPASGWAVPDARGILVNAPRIGAAELERLPGLEVLARFGSGMDNIDIVECERRGVRARNIPGPIATEMVGAIVGLVTERLFELDRKKRAFVERGWVSRNDIGAVGMADAVIGLVGAGRISTRVAEVFRLLGARVCFASPSLPDGAGGEIGERLGLGELCAEADAVVVLSPLRADTRCLIGREQIAQMRPTAHLIAISRGGVVDQAAALAALRAGAIASLHLDVFEREPMDPDELPPTPGLTLTAHNAAWSQAFVRETLREATGIFRRALL